MKKRFAVACLLILACAPPLAARQSKEVKPETLPPVLRDAFKPADVPEGKGSWVLQVITRGGIAGRGYGDLTVTSDGKIVCGSENAPCAITQTGASQASLSQLVDSAKPSKWRGAVGTCNDCYVSLLALQKREGNGRVKTYTVYWDDTTAASVPSDAKNILRALAALAFVPAKPL